MNERITFYEAYPGIEYNRKNEAARLYLELWKRQPGTYRQIVIEQGAVVAIENGDPVAWDNTGMAFHEVAMQLQGGNND